MARKKRFVQRNRFFMIMFVLFAVYFGVTMVRQELKVQELAKEEQELKQQKSALVAETDDLKKDLEASKTPEYTEKIAREKLKMVKPDEIIYILKEKQ